MPLLPRIYIINDDITKQLKRYIQAYDVILSEVKTRTESFPDIFNISECDVKYLPYLAYLLGLEINESQLQKDVRKLIKNAVFIYSRKGTSIGLRAFSEALTGWNVLIEEDSPTSVKIWIDKEQYDADLNRALKHQLLTQYAPDYIPIPLTFSIDLLEDEEDLGDQLVNYHNFGISVVNDMVVEDVTHQDIVEIGRIDLYAREAPVGADLKVEITEDGVGTGQIATLTAGSQQESTDVSHVFYAAKKFGLKIIQTGIAPNEGNSLSATVHFSRTTL